MSSGSTMALMAGRLTISCWTMKSLEVTVKSMILPSLDFFLVSTLRVRRSKLRSRTCWSLTMSSYPTSSSMLSMTMPSLEYSRMDETSRRLADGLGPLIRKAMILRPFGSTIVLEICPMGPAAWMLRMGVPMSLLFSTNIT